MLLVSSVQANSLESAFFTKIAYLASVFWYFASYCRLRITYLQSSHHLSAKHAPFARKALISCLPSAGLPPLLHQPFETTHSRYCLHPHFSTRVADCIKRIANISYPCSFSIAEICTETVSCKSSEGLILLRLQHALHICTRLIRIYWHTSCVYYLHNTAINHRENAQAAR